MLHLEPSAPSLVCVTTLLILSQCLIFLCSTVTLGLSHNHIQPTLCCESPSLSHIQSNQLYPTPFMRNKCGRISEGPLYTYLVCDANIILCIIIDEVHVTATSSLGHTHCHPLSESDVGYWVSPYGAILCIM